MKYKSCHYLETGLFFDINRVSHCCSCTADQNPIIINGYKGQKVKWEKLIDLKRQIKNKCSQGEIPFKVCENCSHFVEKEKEDDERMSHIVVSTWVQCNSSCIYCNKNHGETKLQYEVLPILKELNKKNLIRFNEEFTFIGGEVSLFKEFNPIVDFLLKNNQKRIFIPTSGIKFEKSIIKVLESGSGMVTISPDAGSRELYKKIKQVDCYDKVRKNMFLYNKAAKKGNSLFRSKYIIIPQVNDSLKDIDMWIKECLELEINHIALDLELHYSLSKQAQNKDHILKLYDYVVEQADKYGFDLNIFYIFRQFKHSL